MAVSTTDHAKKVLSGSLSSASNLVMEANKIGDGNATVAIVEYRIVVMGQTGTVEGQGWCRSAYYRSFAPTSAWFETLMASQVNGRVVGFSTPVGTGGAGATTFTQQVNFSSSDDYFYTYWADSWISWVNP